MNECMYVYDSLCLVIISVFLNWGVFTFVEGKSGTRLDALGQVPR